MITKLEDSAKGVRITPSDLAEALSGMVAYGSAPPDGIKYHIPPAHEGKFREHFGDKFEDHCVVVGDIPT